ncbi:hypothetical protein [Aestuariimicrobium sp. Y1814]|uniref:hypothetical protein n=1 Tax=Aestuariimicrobium sp. Y1814 TaxID=3418742 RepID=UPI003DA777A3
MALPLTPAIYRVPDNVAWIDGTEVGTNEELYLTVVPQGNTVLLTGTARMIWLVAAGGGDVVAGVADLVGRAPAEIADEINRFLSDLVGRGLLHQSYD